MPSLRSLHPIEYSTWKHLRQRCSNPKDKGWRNYGGRGIRVHPDWDSFDAFFAEVGARPTPQHSLDRYPNNDGSYEPGNVRWATRKEQTRNRRCAFYVERGGRRVMLADLVDELGLNRQVVYERISTGWSIEEAISAPTRKYARGVA